MTDIGPETDTGIGRGIGRGEGPVMVAMSGGVDSSVAAALLAGTGREVVGVTLKLWGGESDSGCCSVADVDDARRVADHLGIEHHVFNFSSDFDRHVVDPYVADHQRGATPNPCIECNRHLKFDRLLERAGALGFDHVATGHHARIVLRPDGTRRVARGADGAKDQSYVVHMLDQDDLGRVEFPLGAMTKDDVRRHAAAVGLRTADKPDSQDVCFVTSAEGRRGFLSRRIPLRAGRVVDQEGREVGAVDAVELVTVGQRRGLGIEQAGGPHFVTGVDAAAATVTIGSRRDLLTAQTRVERLSWADRPVSGPVLAQTAAHGRATPARLTGDRVLWDEPRPVVAEGQSVVFYEGDEVIGGGLALS